jgi:orotidine-5'-phosphate decarboxylase
MMQPVAGPTFLEKLTTSARRNQSWLCVGLDPEPSLIAARAGTDGVVPFLRGIIEATSDLVCCYKPNLGFFEALGPDGLQVLRRALEAVPAGIPTLADAKRGDIGNTARGYAQGLFDQLGFDAATVNPYLGGDALAPFFAYPDKGVFVLVRTSNPGAADFQQLPVALADGRRVPLFEVVAERALSWDQHGTLGLVVGATAPEAVARVRAIAPRVPLLLPGVGPQGGALEATVAAAVDERGEGAIVNASRGVLYADDPRRAAWDLRAAINAARQASTAARP